MSKLSVAFRWTFQNDFAEPFLEIILFIYLLIIASNNFLNANDISPTLSLVTWQTIYPTLFLVGIGGVRCFGQGVERGEIARQIIIGRNSRSNFLLNKFTSFYILTLFPLVVGDFVGLIEYEVYYFSPSAYAVLGTGPLQVWGLLIFEQVILLFFLDSLVLLLNLVLRKTTVTLLVFLAYTILGATFYTLSPPSWAASLQLGYGDYQLVNVASRFLFSILSSGQSIADASNDLGLDFYFGLFYRMFVGIFCLILSIAIFSRIDLD